MNSMRAPNAHFACLCAAILFAGSSALAAVAGERASFITGTFVIADGCAKLAKIAAGGDRNVETVPETLDADGFHGWEGGCTFKSIVEKEAGRIWEAQLMCTDAAEEWEETDTLTLDDTAGKITVVVDDKQTEFTRCDAAKGSGS